MPAAARAARRRRRLHDREPEEERRTEEGGVLHPVPERIAERELVERRCVPAPGRDREEQRCDRRPHEEARGEDAIDNSLCI